MKYKYTLMKQDGEIEEIGELDCELDYKYGDEEGRFNSNNHQNPHFASRKDERGTLWNVVGDILREEKLNA